MGRRTLLGAGAALVTAALALPALANSRAGVEEPDFRVNETHENFEVRTYAPRILARVTVEAKNPRKASNAGFRILAGYIFGDNEASNEIAMTAPVGRSQTIDMTAPVGRENAGDTDRWLISFTMPSQWTLETLPRPKDDRIEILEVPATSYAVRRFAGSPSDAVVRERELELREWALDAGLSPADGPAIYNRYDPPWIPGFARRNEIWVQLSTPKPTKAN